jgi:20S proteasome alpha/beta subunit
VPHKRNFFSLLYRYLHESVYYVDSDGACIEGDIFCVGSGAQLAYGILDTVQSSTDRQRVLPPSTFEEEDSSAVDRLSTTPVPHETDQTEQREPVLAADPEPAGLSSTARAATAAVLASLSLDEAVAAAVRAVRHATYRDGYSGGFINVFVVNAEGVQHAHRIDSKAVPM